jgi:hypothetical protein
VTHPLRTLVGCAALAAGLWVITAASAAGPEAPELPKESIKKAADADLKFLQERLADLAKKQAGGMKLLDGQIKPALGVALLLAAYGDALGDANLKADALKVIDAIDQKKFAMADGLAKKLAVKPGAAGKPGPLPKPLKDERMLEAVMSPFRGSTVGGLGIDKDIKDMTKNMMPTKIDPAAVEILAVRAAFINAYATNIPNQKASTNAGTKQTWDKLSKDSVDFSKQLVGETAKGAKSDEKKTKQLLSNLLGRCNKCHEDFRDE